MNEYVAILLAWAISMVVIGVRHALAMDGIERRSRERRRRGAPLPPLEHDAGLVDDIADAILDAGAGAGGVDVDAGEGLAVDWSGDDWADDDTPLSAEAFDD